MVRLYRVILPVSDIAEAERFYSRLLGMAGKRVSPGRHYFDCGGTILACYEPGADGDSTQESWKFHPMQYLYFAVPNLEEALARVKAAGGTIDDDIASMPWGERMFYARDPLGSLISFVDERTVF